MYQVVTSDNHNEVWAIGDYKPSLERKLEGKYWHKFMYEKDKHKTLIIIETLKK